MFLKTFLVLLALCGSASAAGPGATSANFLKIPVGARQTATGASFIAVADDPSAIYYNPAGLAQLETPQAVLVHNKYFEDIAQQWFAAALPTERGTFGLALNYLSIPPFPSYSAANARTGSVSAYDLAANFAYAGRRALDNDSFEAVLYGVNARYLTQNLDTENAYGYGLDAGLLLKHNNKRLTLAAAVDNLYASEIKFISEGFKQPRTLKAGAAYRLTPAADNKLVLSLGANFPEYGTASAALGVEDVFMDLFALRAGYNSFGDVAQGVSLGFGLKLPAMAGNRIEVDYSFSSTYDLGPIHKLGLLYKFGPAPRPAAAKPAAAVEAGPEDPEELPFSCYAETLKFGKPAEKLAVIRELAGYKWEKSSVLLTPLLSSGREELRAAAAASIERALKTEKDAASVREMREVLVKYKNGALAGTR
jgi:hypothetical protein